MKGFGTQMGFDALIADAQRQNSNRIFERQTAHLPSSMDEGVPYFRALIDRHHEAMMKGDVEAVMAIREEARMLAQRLNGGDIGYLAQGAPGRVLEAQTRAADGVVPLWGQRGTFVVDVDDMRVCIELDGMFGISCSTCFWPGFAAHIVDRGKPFLSETGYRSFLGIQADAVPGLTPDAFATAVIAKHISEAAKPRRTRRG